MLAARAMMTGKPYDKFITTLITIFEASPSSEFNLKVAMCEEKANNKEIIDVPVTLNDLETKCESLVDAGK